ATVWVGAATLTRVDTALLSSVLGVLLVSYAALSLGRVPLVVGKRHEAWAGPLIGGVNGVLTGMTGASSVPGVAYLQGIGLPRDQLIQAMGMLFTASTVALALALGGNRLLSAELAAWSTAAVLPALMGMVLGQRLRRRLSEQRFRQVFFLALMALGGYITARSLVAWA
ncbi:MAG: sulfite exporter TauE/SafE family protein, partial [Pseudomonadota bacterium]